MEELAEKETIDEPIGGLEVLQKEDVLKTMARQAGLMMKAIITVQVKS